MKALLDTHAILYLAADTGRLGPRVRELLASDAVDLHASLASYWEICIKLKLGKLELGMEPAEFWKGTLSRARIIESGIGFAAISRTMDLDLSHRDPFDRLLAAQALVLDMTFLSSDDAVDRWGVRRLW